MSTPFIDLTDLLDKDSDFDFSEVDGLSNEDLASINIEDIIRQSNMDKDSNEMSDKSPLESTEDILSQAIRAADGPVTIKVEDDEVKGTDDDSDVSAAKSKNTPIPAEITVQQNSSEPVLARKSAPDVPVSNIDNGFKRASDVLVDNQRTDSSSTRLKIPRSSASVSITPVTIDVESDSKSGIDEKSQPNNQRPEVIITKILDQDSSGHNQANNRIRFEAIEVPRETSKQKERTVSSDALMSVSTQIIRSVECLSKPTTGSNVSGFKDVTKNGEYGFTKHNFPLVSADVMRGPDPLPNEIPGEKEFISVRELALPDRTTKRTVPAGIVPFLLVEFKDEKWSAVPTSQWEIVTNKIEMKVLQTQPILKHVMRQARRWKGSGFFGLSSLNLIFLEQWRDIIPTINPLYNTFPRDSLSMGDEVTIMLMDQYRSYNIECLPSSLLSRNDGLEGHVRISYSKVYGPRDFTFHRQSKDGWCLVYLEGDSVFLQSLSQFSSDAKFEVGCSLVTIRGGIRKPSLSLRRFSSTHWQNKSWVKDPVAPLLRTLTPVVSSTPSSIMVEDADMVLENPRLAGEVAKKQVSVKPRNKNERLKIARNKKLAYKLRSRAD